MVLWCVRALTAKIRFAYGSQIILPQLKLRNLGEQTLSRIDILAAHQKSHLSCFATRSRCEAQVLDEVIRNNTIAIDKQAGESHDLSTTADGLVVQHFIPAGYELTNKQTNPSWFSFRMFMIHE
jgi:hypothetical protein